MRLLRALLVVASLVALPGVVHAQAKDDRRGATTPPPPPPRSGAQAERERDARPRAPEAVRPRTPEQPQQPRSREPQLKRRKP